MAIDPDKSGAMKRALLFGGRGDIFMLPQTLILDSKLNSSSNAKGVGRHLTTELLGGKQFKDEGGRLVIELQSCVPSLNTVPS